MFNRASETEHFLGTDTIHELRTEGRDHTSLRGL
jgi:hypothetical protein